MSGTNLRDTQEGRQLLRYWTEGPGSKWKTSPHPYTALLHALTKAIAKHGKTVRDIEGLAANIFQEATGQYPGQRAKGQTL